MSILMGLIFGGVVLKKGFDNKDKEEFINYNVKKAHDLVSRIDRNIDTALENCNKSLENLYNANKLVCDTTFCKFVSFASNMINIEFDADIDKAQKMSGFQENISLNVKSVSSNFNGAKGLLLASGVMTPCIGLITQSVYSIKLDGITAESRAELSKVKSAVEIAKREIAKMKSITKLSDSATATITAMQRIGDLAVDKLEEIISVNGYDYNSYSEDDKNSVWLTFKIMSALNELINMKILTPSGAISAKFRKFVGDINTDFLE